MRFFSGVSTRPEGEAAVAEATASFPTDQSPEVVFVFVSTAQDPGAVARALQERFPDSIVVGCTTTGEILDGERHRGSVVLSAVYDSGIRWAVYAHHDLEQMTQSDCAEAVRDMYSRLGVNAEEVDPSEFFCMSFVDGLRGREEVVTAQVAEALEGVRLVGGSAGDDLAFKQTQVICGARAFTNGIVLLMGQGKDRFEIVKHQHFKTTGRRLAVTKVDTAARRVYEFDGRPALTAYGEALGLTPEEVTGDVTFMNPVTCSCRGEIYVRSIREVHSDGSLSFYCGVEEGMVLDVGGHEDFVERLETDLRETTAEKGPFEFLIGWNCILRALESEKGGHGKAMAGAWRSAAKVSVGFDTYGEQLDGLHINQTLTALGFRGAA